jgi:hypothetical protein
MEGNPPLCPAFIEIDGKCAVIACIVDNDELSRRFLRKGKDAFQVMLNLPESIANRDDNIDDRVFGCYGSVPRYVFEKNFKIAQ